VEPEGQPTQSVSGDESGGDEKLYVACVRDVMIIREREKGTRMWASAQPDGRPAEHRWRPLFNAAKFG